MYRFINASHCFKLTIKTQKQTLTYKRLIKVLHYMQFPLNKANTFMLKYNSEEIFSAERSPEMREELSGLTQKIINMPVYFKAEIIISYLKDHCIKSEWIIANPELVKLLLSGSFITRHIESLFDFCRLKPGYRLGYESYIKKTVLN